MTTLDTSKASGGEGKRGFFTLYKPGQGKYVRWGTVVALGLIIVLGMYWLGTTVVKFLFPSASAVAIAIVVGVFALVGAFLTFLAVNRPRPAEFMIMTESEMRKVTWPSRQTVVNSTKVVIFLTLLMAIILWAVDVGFLKLFMWMKILSK